MPRKHTSRADVDRKSAGRSSRSRRQRSARRGTRGHQELSDLDQMELLAIVCNYFCQGYKPGEIQAALKNNHAIRVSREEPYQLISRSSNEGWMHFIPPQEYELAEKIGDAFSWLQDVRVVQTAMSEDVARSGAKMLLQLLRQHFARKEAHVGFSGGFAMRQLARHFADLLRRPTQNLPSKIVFHAMVAGFDVFNPTTDPNAFFTYFVQDSAMQVETAFVGLHTPAVVEPDQLPQLRELNGIKQSYEHAHELNIIVTSARDWRDEHSALLRYMKMSGQSLEEFERAGAVGDILWRPIGRDGPVEIEAKLRAMTIMELSDVSEFVKQGKRVLLVAGPCAECLRPKTEIVKTILNQKRPLVTHLVTDSRCGRELLSSLRVA